MAARCRTATVANVLRPYYNLANSTGYYAGESEWTNVYVHCNACRQSGRNCDRKRPCESCVERNLACEPASWGTGIFVADIHAGERSRNYYMALGHGPEGLGTAMVMRDPTRIACGLKQLLAHWKNWKAPNGNATPGRKGARHASWTYN